MLSLSTLQAHRGVCFEDAAKKSQTWGTHTVNAAVQLFSTD